VPNPNFQGQTPAKKLVWLCARPDGNSVTQLSTTLVYKWNNTASLLPVLLLLLQ